MRDGTRGLVLPNGGRQGSLSAIEASLKGYARGARDLLRELSWDAVARVVDELHQARLRRATVFVCGNGGSAATASHMVNDLAKGATVQGLPRFRAIGLQDNLPLLTAWSNDDGYDRAYAEILRNLARPGDLLVAISCSGASANVLTAAALARELGVCVIALVGRPDAKLLALADLAIVAPVPDAEEETCGRCIEQEEDLHLLLEHGIVLALRQIGEAYLVPSMLLANGRGASAQRLEVAAQVPLRRAVFLDRDGVINANRPDHVTAWEQFEFLPGALEATRRLAELNVPVVVVTNQACISRGLVDMQVVESMHLRLMNEVARLGGRIDGVIWCPHHPDQGCQCRKPEPGMLHYAAGVLRLDLSRSVLIGDALSDVEAAVAAGCHPHMVLSGRGGGCVEDATERFGDRCRIHEDLSAAAEWLLDRHNARETQRSCVPGVSGESAP